MEFNHPEYEDASFEVSEDWTVRQVLDYDSQVEGRFQDSMYVRLWSALQTVVSEDDWHCEDVPLHIDIDDLSGKNAKKKLDIIKWASRAVFTVRQVLDESEKN